jgi:hypothetical protein
MYTNKGSRVQRRPRGTARWCPALLLATLLLAAGCGSHSSPRDELRHAWSDMKNAVVAGNATKFCAVLSDNARAQLLALAGGAANCDSAAKTMFDVARDARGQLGHVHLTAITIHGDTATTTDTAGPSADRWTWVNGGWKVASVSS